MKKKNNNIINFPNSLTNGETEVKALFLKYFNMNFDKDYEKKESKKIIKFPNSKC